MTQLLPVTLLVITRDEAANIARCLDSVPFAAEKIVVDSGSTDGTQAIAQQHGARVVHQDWLGFGPQRNFATTQATHDWILSLDADEALSPELSAEMQRKLPALVASDAAGAILRREAWYMGDRMRWYRPMVGERLIRIYHRQRAQWSDARVHESLLLRGRVEEFAASFRHHHSPTLVHKQLKVLSYSELKALDWLAKGRAPRPWQIPFAFAHAFFKDYFLRLAFLDGWRGLAVAQIAASYAAYKRLRYYEMVCNPDSRAAAAQALAKHGLVK
jgi:glycosyltransferase involved in cell wall biosynthesis